MYKMKKNKIALLPNSIHENFNVKLVRKDANVAVDSLLSTARGEVKSDNNSKRLLNTTIASRNH